MYPGSTVVKHSAHYLKVEGSNPTSDTEERKNRAARFEKCKQLLEDQNISIFLFLDLNVVNIFNIRVY